MTKEKLENYANVLLRNYAPKSKTEANYDMRNKVNTRKLREVESLIMGFPKDIDVTIRQEVANKTKQELTELYTSYSMQ